ncbi:MAG: sugar transferase [Bacteroidetes bacterium]|nr:sugar transferase [Bacteroidota bacterium]
MLKRTFDFFSSLFALIIFSPFLLITALLIKLHDRGSVFYMAPRVGLNGKLFTMYKFRSMVVNADKLGPSSTTKTDSRLTPIGKFLRKYKLDELPQLLNVFIGEMSIVGPRPEVKYFTDMFNEKEKAILSVKPGITDFASVWNSDEAAILEGSDDADKTYMEKIRPHKINLQLKYIREQNFFTDMKIIFLTIKTIFSKSESAK